MGVRHTKGIQVTGGSPVGRRCTALAVGGIALSLAVAPSVGAVDVTSSWLGGDGAWSDPARWGNAPAVVAFPNQGNLGLTYDAVISSGAATLDRDITLERLLFHGGSIGGDAALTLNAGGAWTAGALLGPGSVTTRGAFTLTGKTDKRLDRRVLNNAGSAVWDQGLFITANSAVINNLAGATFEVRNVEELRTLTGGALRPVFNNSGSFVKGGAAGLTRINATFNNAGAVTVAAGTLELKGGGTHTGTFDVAPGARLTLTTLNGPSVLSPGSAVRAHAGTLRVVGSGDVGVNIGANVNVGAMEIVSGGHEVPAGATLRTGKLTLFGGNLTLTRDASGFGRVLLNGDFQSTPGSSASASIRGGGVLDLGGATRRFNVEDAANEGVDLDILAEITEGGIRKTGTGTLALRGVHTFRDGITVEDGTVAVDSDAALGAPPGPIVLTVGTLRATNTFATSRHITLGVEGGEGIGTVDVRDAGDTMTVKSSVRGSGTLVKTGPGTLVLEAGSDYTGPTFIRGGRLRLGPNGSVAASRYPVEVRAGATLEIAGTAPRALRGLRGGGTVLLGGGTLTLDDDGAVHHFAGTVGGSGTLVKAGPGESTLAGPLSFTGGGVRVEGGTLVLSGDNTFTGGATIRPGGTLAVSAERHLGGPSSAVTLDGGTLRAAGTFATGRALAVTAAGGAIDVDDARVMTFQPGPGTTAPLSGPGSLTKRGGGELRLRAEASLVGAEVGEGTLALAGPTGSLAVASLSLGAGGRVLLDSSTASGGNHSSGDRLADSGAILGRGGTLALLGADAALSSESAGELSLLSGTTMLELDAGPGGAAELRLAALTRAVGAMVVFVADDLGGLERVFINGQPVGPVRGARVDLGDGEAGPAAYHSGLGILPLDRYNQLALAGDLPPAAALGGPDHVGTQVVPEPSGGVVLLIVVAGTLARRRRPQRRETRLQTIQSSGLRLVPGRSTNVR